LKKYLITQPLFFGLIILIFLLTTFTLLNLPLFTNLKKNHLTNSSLENQSYQYTHIDNTDIIVDPNSIQSMNIDTNSRRDNKILIILFIYTIIISLLFIYREKENRKKILYLDKIEDTLRIEQEIKNKQNYIYESIENGLLKYQSILEPEFLLKELSRQVKVNRNYVLINSRVVLEKIILHIYKAHFTEDTTLNNMIKELFKKRIFTPSLNSYAHTIKAFGNKALHPSIEKSISFEVNEAMLVLSSLNEFLKELNKKNLLENIDVSI